MDFSHITTILRELDEIPLTIEFLKFDELCFTKIINGYLNDVIRVSSKVNPKKSIIFKQSPPYIKFLGPKHSLSTIRNHVEYMALSRCHKTVPGFVPEPYYCDQHLHFVIMEDLDGYKDMRMEMIRGSLDEGVALDIADFIYKLHKYSHKNNLSVKEFSKLDKEFKNDDMIKMTYDIRFTKPWNEHEPLNKPSEEVKQNYNLIYGHKELMENVEELRNKVLLQKECLLHGDLHTGSIMTKGEYVKVIDLEFAHVGPAASDIGLLLANYLFSFHAHRLYPQATSPTFHQTVKIAIIKTIEHYFSSMATFLNQRKLELLCQETAGFTGCEIIGWIISPVSTADLEGRPQAEVECLKLGVDLIIKYKDVKSYKDLLTVLGMS